ncbi:MAG: Glutamyl-tRNA reductase [Chlamydiales bacterium]|nr:Glutamyl-tRNA reductase [Chlamydiales bacterium]MCH9619385.1 Glutamyl-tRNA reductase [Chlamydiales bacterium]MCH9622189.1 Glutamyl-tRNA reductase [Chlamydiales bacterium]
MRIGVIGINHKLASLTLREKIAKVCSRRFNPCSLHSKIAYIPLSTCNRTEIYFHADNLSEAHSYLLYVLREGIDEEFEQRVYSYFGIDCFQHLARVTAGLDSAMIGETEIQGQVKQAYLEAKEKLPSELHFLFQKSLKIGKQVRSQFTIRRGLSSLEETIYATGSEYLGGLEDKKILFVGVSNINQKIYSWLQRKKIGKITYCNRTAEKISHPRKLDWENLERWHTYDLVIFGTKCPHFLIENAPRLSGSRLLIDLSVPRNVNPKMARHPQLKLMNIDQLIRVMERNRNLKLSELEWIESQIIDKESKKQFGIFTLKKLSHLQGIA